MVTCAVNQRLVHYEKKNLKRHNTMMKNYPGVTFRGN